jgi:hypothetical protein
VREIVRQLRAELKREIRQLERAIKRGKSANVVLKRNDPRFSPLARYITALRADQAQLARQLAPAAAAQHQACPLYRRASLELIPAESYSIDRLPSDPRAKNAPAATLLSTYN